MKLINRVIFVALLLLASAGMHAKELMFRHLEAEEGLSNSQINSIFQDSRGFMWFGTSSGLNRYDGYRMTVYRNRLDDVRSLPDSYIRDICEDGEGMLWVRTSVGYAIYNPDTDLFDRDVKQYVFRFGLSAEPTFLLVDKAGNYWFYVAGDGCYWYNTKQKILFRFPQSDKPGDLPEGEITGMTTCQEGVLLVYANGLLACINGDQRRIVWMNDYIPASGTSPKGTYSAFVDKNENVWVYGLAGVRVYNKEKNKWIPSLAALAAQWNIPHTPEMDGGIVGIGQDGTGVLWIATRHYGLLVADPQAQRFTWARADKEDRRALLHNSLRTLYVSPDKRVVWVGTAKSGVAWYSDAAFKFHTDVKVDVTAIAPDSRQAYWLGTSGHGILHYDSHTRTVTPLKSSVQLDEHELFSLIAARDGSLWTGTNKGVIFRLRNGVATTYQIVSAGMNPVPVTAPIASLIEDDRGNIWVATLGAGLQCLDPRTGKLTVYDKEHNGLPSDKVNSLSFTKERHLLLGTPNGVAVLDMVKHSVTCYTGCRNGNFPFTSLYVNQVVEDHRGLWWIATRDGVNIYDVKNDRLDVIGAAEGFRNAVVCGVVPSGEQTVWASTAGGVSCIVVEKNDTGTEYVYRIYNYTEEDGLQGYEFNQRSIWVKPDGEVAVGGIHGCNVFRPAEIIYNKKLPRVIFSGLRVFDRDVAVGEAVDGKVILHHGIGTERQIELDADRHAAFTVLFGSDDYCVPAKNTFKYKLEGFCDEWYDCTPLRNGVTFTNLSPGKYVLKVKAVNSDGYSSNEAAQLTIVVKGSPWTAWWAWLIYAVLLLAVLSLSLAVWKKRERARIRRSLLASGYADGREETEEATNAAAETETVPVETAQEETVPPLVVVVDENPEFLTYLCECLEEECRLMTATDAEQAWERILLQQPAAVVMDVETPDSPLYGLACRVKSDTRTAAIPLLGVTGAGMRYTPTDGHKAMDAALPKPFTRDMLTAALRSLLQGERPAWLSDNNGAEEQAEESVSDKAEDALVGSATRYVMENLSRADLSVEEMARQMDMSRAHLYKRLMATCGKTPVEFIRHLRLKRAAELLKDPRYNVSEVAYQVGFNNPKYFSRYFADAYGMLPSEWQGKYRGNTRNGGVQKG